MLHFLRGRKLSFQRDTALTQACSLLLPGFFVGLWVCSSQESGRTHTVPRPLISTYVGHLFSTEAGVAFMSLSASGCNVPKVQWGLTVDGRVQQFILLNDTPALMVEISHLVEGPDLHFTVV